MLSEKNILFIQAVQSIVAYKLQQGVNINCYKVSGFVLYLKEQLILSPINRVVQEEVL